MIAKISVGEAPDLIKLAKTEHLTPIEERIKDLHESMNAGQHAQTPPLGPIRIWRRRLSMARLAVLGGSALPGGEASPLGAQPLPRVLELTASILADSTAVDPPGGARHAGSDAGAGRGTLSSR